MIGTVFRVVISRRNVITIQKVSVVRRCLSLWHLHHIWLVSQPSDDDWFWQAGHQAAGQHGLQVVLSVPVLLQHQLRHIILHQPVTAAADFLAGIGI